MINWLIPNIPDGCIVVV